MIRRSGGLNSRHNIERDQKQNARNFSRFSWNITSGRHWDVFMGLVICANIAFIGLEANAEDEENEDMAKM